MVLSCEGQVKVQCVRPKSGFPGHRAGHRRDGQAHSCGIPDPSTTILHGFIRSRQSLANRRRGRDLWFLPRNHRTETYFAGQNRCSPSRFRMMQSLVLAREAKADDRRPAVQPLTSKTARRNRTGHGARTGGHLMPRGEGRRERTFPLTGKVDSGLDIQSLSTRNALNIWEYRQIHGARGRT